MQLSLSSANQQAIDASLKLDGKTIFISGPLTFASANLLVQKLAELPISSGHWQFDLSQVTKGDSAGAAFLLHVIRLYKQKNATVTWLAIPHDLQVIIQVCGLTELL